VTPDSTRFDRLVDLVYEAAFEPDGWYNVMRAIAEALNSVNSTLVLGDSDDPERAVVRTLRFEPEIDFAAGRKKEDQVYPRSVRMSRGTVHRGSEVISLKDLLKTALYADVIRPIDTPFMLGKFVELGGFFENCREFVGGFSVLRDSSQGEYTLEEKAFLDALVPHLRRAFALNRRLRLTNDQCDALREALDRTTQAVFIVRSDDTIVFMNKPAEHLLKRSDGICARMNRLGWSDTDAAHAIGETVRRHVGMPDAALSPVIARRTDGAPPYEVRIYPAPRTAVGTSCTDPWSIVTVADPAKRQVHGPTWMAAAFGLSPAEMRIADLVVAGRRTSEIASELHLSTNTVRAHLKRIFQKVGVHTQAQLAIAFA
jgi:DNA-binding CsgD family transcriptional regulator/PAS domain-containing protein